MKIFKFIVTQNASTYYIGEATIEANTEKEAKELLEGMTLEEIESICENWELGDDVVADGEIKVRNLISEEEL